MKKASYISIFIIASLLLVTIDTWPQEKGEVTQGEIAKMVGERMGFPDSHTENLKKLGITPLGEWDEKKIITKEDFDAILIRMARIDPANMKPSEVLDSMGFPPRIASREGVENVFRSSAYRQTEINLFLLLSPSALPLPPGYGPKILGAAGPTESAIKVAAPAVTVEPQLDLLTTFEEPKDVSPKK